nr:uncharacterized protein C9orf43 homolog isoform X6 [Pelodiscus sinensis]|eukprot:XP_025044866.1 uncharacterized protein C9orf43 homolog isoform X6 [Pelodiscus sinensis]
MVANMVTAGVSQWDETICDMAVCQHPQCWDTIRRIEQGQPRIRLRNFDTLCRVSSSESKDELPSLKIVNFPSNCSPQERIRCSNCNRTISSLAALETSFSPSLYETSVYDFFERNSEVSLERTHFPGLNSVAESRVMPQREMSFTYLNKVGNLQVIELSEAAAPKQDYYPDSGNLIVKWIPNIHKKSQRPEVEAVTKLKPLRRVCVKDLVSENLSSLKELHRKGTDHDIIPVLSLNEQGLERISNRPYLRKPCEGSLGARGPESKSELQPGYAAARLLVLTTQSLESCTLDGTEKATSSKRQLSQKPPLPSAEPELQGWEGPRKQQVGLGKRRSSGMYVPYKSTLVLEGVGENGPLLPRPESRYGMYCKQLASRKEAAQALGYLQGRSSWLQSSPAALTLDSDKYEDDSYPNPPPPPPSPSPLREYSKLFPGSGGPFLREDSLLSASSECLTLQ